ncbi:MAG: NAD-dependent epimerase/dehydratase family protein [Anaerolineales bacterium]|nr:NAD-dependent epimerase/dehydratase family protein [Anaerolineales bacterium]
MRTLVLGATSLIGNNVLRAAIDAGWETVVLEQASPRRAALEGLEAEIIAGNPDEPDALVSAMRGCETLFHTAGYSPPNRLHHLRRLAQARQHIGRVLRAAQEARITRLVYTSSTSTIGRPDTPSSLPDEWNRYRLGQALHPYWDAKLVQEEAVLAFGRESGIPVVILNASEAVGPFDFDLVASQPLLEMARRGSRRYMPGRISVADARDMAQGHIMAAQHGRAGERYIVAGHNITRQEMTAVMAFACKRPPPDRPVNMHRFERWTRFSERLSCLGRRDRPFPLGYLVAAVRLGGWYASGKARAELGYTNRPLINSFRTTLSWLQEMSFLR